MIFTDTLSLTLPPQGGGNNLETPMQSIEEFFSLRLEYGETASAKGGNRRDMTLRNKTVLIVGGTLITLLVIMYVTSAAHRTEELCGTRVVSGNRAGAWSSNDHTPAETGACTRNQPHQECRDGGRKR